MVVYTDPVAENKNKSKSNKTDHDIVEVKHPGADYDAEFLEQQNAALQHYKLTGVNDQGYVDSTRDQEPDIAPEFGVSPHPELANPAPPRESFSGRALDEDAVPMVKSVDEKEEDGAEAVEAYNEYLQKRDELFEATKDTPVVGPVQRVVVVEEKDVAADAVPDLPADGSMKVSQQSAVNAQLPNASDGVPTGDDAKSDADKSKSDS